MNSLRTKIIFIFVALIMVLGISLGIFTYVSSTRMVLISIGSQAKNIAERAVQQINIGDFKSVLEALAINPDDETIQKQVMSSPEYINIQELLYQLKEINGLRYLYTMTRREDGNFMYVVDGLPMDDEEASIPGEVETEEYSGLIRAYETGKIELDDLTNDKKYGALLTAYVPIIDENDQIIGVMGADYDATEIYKLLSQNLFRSMIIFIIVLAVAIVISYLTASIFLKPLSKLASIISKVGQGDLTIDFAGDNSQGEVGKLKLIFTDTVSKLNAMVKAVKDTAGRVGVLSDELYANLETTAGANQEIARMVIEVTEGAKIMANGAKETSQAMSEVAQGVQQIAVTSSVVSELSEKTLQEAEFGNDAVQNAFGQMKSIESSVQKSVDAVTKLVGRMKEIGQILEVITNISSQTNLLALNATIEAARAGEHGTGFAVVAETIRKLSDQTSESTNRIAKIVHEIEEQSTRSIRSMGEVTMQVFTGLEATKNTGEIFQSIVTDSQQLSKQIQDISAASEEISASTEEVTGSVEVISSIAGESLNNYQVVEENSQKLLNVMKEMSGLGKNLSHLADELEGLIAKFEVK